MNYSRERGFSLLELTIVVGIVAFMFYVALDKLLALAVQAEQVSVLQMEGSLQSALGIQVAYQLAQGKSVGELASMEGMNPLRLLSNRPSNYLGELDHPNPAAIEGGHWYFDSSAKELVYRVNHDRYFRDSLGQPARIEYQVQVKRSNGSIVGVALVTLTPYQWQSVPLNPLEYQNLH
jgi:type II secretory pathway pseudopilin PulG